MRRVSVVRILALVVLIGCAGAKAAPERPPGDPPRPLGYLVWTVTGDHQVTRWLDAGGRERGRADGIWIAGGARLWHLSATPRELTTTGCVQPGGEQVTPGKAELTELRLVGGGAPLTLATGGSAPEDDLEVTHVAQVVAGLGRYVFVEESTHEYGCGAHGNTTVSAHVVDLTTRANVAPWVAAKDLGRRADDVRRELAKMAMVQPGEPLGEVHVAQTLPVWKSGHLTVRHLIWVDACYACGNDLWSSYTASAWVPDERVPPPLADEAVHVPEAVARAVPEDASAAGVSWGTTSSAWSSTFRAAASAPASARQASGNAAPAATSVDTASCTRGCTYAHLVF